MTVCHVKTNELISNKDFLDWLLGGAGFFLPTNLAKSAASLQHQNLVVCELPWVLVSLFTEFYVQLISLCLCNGFTNIKATVMQIRNLQKINQRGLFESSLFSVTG